jgi:RimJ/RimL family protein N-acetyltransferase
LLADGRVRLRRHAAEDRRGLVDAVNRSLPELRPWMSWAQAPATAESIGVFLADSRAAWEKRREFGYAIRPAAGDPKEAEIIGSCGLRVEARTGLAEIGYWVRTDRTGQGVATSAARALTLAAREMRGVVRIEIHCDAANGASRAVAGKLGYRLDHIERRPPSPRSPAETDELLIWVHDGLTPP